MAFRTRRQARYSILRSGGFLPFEAQKLSKVPFRVPYMVGMLRERLRDYERALAKKWSRTRYEAATKVMYKDRGWTKRVRGRTVYDPWEMLRGYEDRYRDKHPEYSSPWERRRRDFRKYVRDLEASIKKYPRGAKTVKIRYLPTGGAEIVGE